MISSWSCTDFQPEAEPNLKPGTAEGGRTKLDRKRWPESEYVEVQKTTVIGGKSF